ncbi:MAG: Bax inhibitor-1 family protein [Hafnia sp.]
MFSNDTFKRTGSDTISNASYNLLIGAVLLWGFALNWYMVATIPFETIKAINPIVFLVGYVVSALAGVWMFSASTNPVVSFIGYNLVALPVGLVLVLTLPGHSAAVIESALQTTVFVTLAMMIAGSMFPKFFASIGPGLFWALLIAIIVELVQVLVFKVKLSIMDWIVAAIFCGYIGFDWVRANSIPKTVDNAVDSAASLYLDIINLFVRILGIKSND